MGRLTYSAIASLDGYVADEQGRWDWSEPDDEVHAFVNDRTRPIRTHLLGRRMYDVLVAWETMDEPEPEMRDFVEIWRGSDKVVYSRTLQAPRSARARIERSFDPEGVRERKAAGDCAIGRPDLGAQALSAGLVDELDLYLSPVVVGGGTPALPAG